MDEPSKFQEALNTCNTCHYLNLQDHNPLFRIVLPNDYILFITGQIGWYVSKRIGIVWVYSRVLESNSSVCIQNKDFGKLIELYEIK